MSRDRFGEADDYHDGPPGRPVRQSNPALVIGLVIAGALLVVVLVCGGMMFLFAFRAGDNVAQQPQAVQVGPVEVEEMKLADEKSVKKKGGMVQVQERENFRRLVMGKTEKEVIDALGEPNIKDEEAGGSKLWIYRNRTINPATGKPDEKVNIRFEDGKVVGVDF